jgi:hypothetical protein
MLATRTRLLVCIVAAAMINCAQFVPAAIVAETWESQANTNPFTGTGDLTWSGDVTAWAITTATWPTAPAQDFAGAHSLRTSNHGSVTGAPVVETVITDVSSAINFSQRMEWNVFFSGNSASIQPSRRADFILLSDSSSVGLLEDPTGLNGYKITLWDPFADGTANTPPSSHESAVGLADTLTLWSVDDTDDRWRVMGSIPLGATDDIRDGWNIRAVRESTGQWSIGFVNGPIGGVPALTPIGSDTVNLSAFSGPTYAGVGWTAPTTDNDFTDFGFDNFRIGTVVPETASIVTWGMLLAFAGLGLAFPKRSPRRLGHE